MQWKTALAAKGDKVVLRSLAFLLLFVLSLCFVKWTCARSVHVHSVCHWSFDKWQRKAQVFSLNLLTISTVNGDGRKINLYVMLTRCFMSHSLSSILSLPLQAVFAHSRHSLLKQTEQHQQQNAALNHFFPLLTQNISNVYCYLVAACT